jgi:hypothetical protein
VRWRHAYVNYALYPSGCDLAPNSSNVHETVLYLANQLGYNAFYVVRYSCDVTDASGHSRRTTERGRVEWDIMHKIRLPSKVTVVCDANNRPTIPPLSKAQWTILPFTFHGNLCRRAINELSSIRTRWIVCFHDIREHFSIDISGSPISYKLRTVDIANYRIACTWPVDLVL